jgi:hypothetical protein
MEPLALVRPLLFLLILLPLTACGDGSLLFSTPELVQDQADWEAGPKPLNHRGIVRDYYEEHFSRNIGLLKIGELQSYKSQNSDKRRWGSCSFVRYRALAGPGLPVGVVEENWNLVLIRNDQVVGFKENGCAAFKADQVILRKTGNYLTW